MRKFQFTHDGYSTWIFDYYGQFTGAVFKDCVGTNPETLQPEYRFYLMMNHVFWKMGDPAESGDILLQSPSLGEAKKFLRENAAMSNIFKKKYGDNVHRTVVEQYAVYEYYGV